MTPIDGHRIGGDCCVVSPGSKMDPSVEHREDGSLWTKKTRFDLLLPLSLGVPCSEAFEVAGGEVMIVSGRSASAPPQTLDLGGFVRG